MQVFRNHRHMHVDAKSVASDEWLLRSPKTIWVINDPNGFCFHTRQPSKAQSTQMRILKLDKLNNVTNSLNVMKNMKNGQFLC